MSKPKVIIVSGYFNPLHKGHLELFEKANAYGDKLWVIVNSDLQRKLKGSKEFKGIKNNISKYEDLISFVDDRPGHDARYAIDASKIDRELGWKPKETFESGMRKTVQWYLANRDSWFKS